MGANEKAGTRMSGWRCVALASVCTVVVLPIAAGFFSPTAIGYVQLPGVVLFLCLAVTCAAFFFVCPRRPLAPKVVSSFLAAHALFWAMYASVYYLLHSVYHA